MTPTPKSLTLRMLHGLLIAPWVVLVALCRAVVAIVAFRGRMRAGMSDVIRCPVGHTNALLGRWSCASGCEFLGHAFDPCPCCGLPAGRIRCSTCSLTILAPLR